MIIKIDFDENGKHDKDNCEPERPSCSSILLPFLSLLSHRLPSLNMVMMMMMMTIAVIILMIMIIIFIINLPAGILASWSLAVSQDWQPPKHDYDDDDDDDDDGDDDDDDHCGDHLDDHDYHFHNQLACRYSCLLVFGRFSGFAAT